MNTAADLLRAPGADARSPAPEALVAALDVRVVALLLDALRSVLPLVQLRVTDGTERLGSMLGTVRPALVLADLNLIDYTVRDLVAQARGLNPDARVIVIAGHGADERILPALRAGAAGFLLKLDPVDELVTQLRSLIAGVLPLTAALARQLLAQLERTQAGLRVVPVEFELLRRIALGDTPAEAAWRLKLERDAVQRHVAHVLEVLQLPGITDV